MWSLQGKKEGVDPGEQSISGNSWWGGVLLMTNRNKEIGLFGIAAALFGGTVAAVPFFA